MTTNRLTKHYGTLTPWERFPLIVAAEARGDEVELDRLCRSTPKCGFNVANSFGLSDGIWKLAPLVVSQLLTFAFRIQQVGHAMDHLCVSQRPRADKQQERRCRNVLGMLGYRFSVNLDGWRLLCDQLSIDANAVVVDLPGHDCVEETEQAARLVAFSEGEYRSHIRAEQPAFVIETVETAAASMRRFLEDSLVEWS